MGPAAAALAKQELAGDLLPYRPSGWRGRSVFLQAKCKEMARRATVMQTASQSSATMQTPSYLYACVGYPRYREGRRLICSAVLLWAPQHVPLVTSIIMSPGSLGVGCRCTAKACNGLMPKWLCKVYITQVYILMCHLPLAGSADTIPGGINPCIFLNRTWRQAYIARVHKCAQNQETRDKLPGKST